MALEIASGRERPDLLPRIWLDEFTSNWPKYAVHGGLIADIFYDGFFIDHVPAPFADFVMIAFDPAQDNRILARAFSVPFALGAEFGRPALPETGWDRIVAWADWDHKAGRTCNAVSALEINVHPDAKSQGLSSLMLRAMRDNAKKLGFKNLYAPVRPNMKHLEPRTPMLEYAHRTREDGLPFDAWLRVHVRAGAEIVKIATASMTFSGSLEHWRAWTDLPFDQSGEVIVPGALAPVLVSLEQNYAAYVEANVWMHHRLED
jgi:GNAT superfamily N-acetyltransferase